MKYRVVPFMFFTCLFLAATLFAAHFSPNGDSVDGGEIRWGDSTIYDDAREWAIDEWNDLGRVDILADTIFTVEDLTWKDVDLCSVSWDGRRVVKIGADAIELNKCYLKNYSTFNRRTVATHELGHGLGLGDHTTSDHPSSSIIMYHCSTCSGVNTPQAHDESDYNSLW